MFNKVISILGTLILLVLAGCRDVAPISVEEPSTENRTITLNLDITTRADYLLPDNSEPDIIRLWIFDESGNFITYVVSSQNVWTPVGTDGIDIETTLQTEIEAENIDVNQSFKIYLLLNQPYTDDGEGSTAPVDFSDVKTLDELKGKMFVLTEYKGDNKVPMTGEGTAEFPSVEGNKIIFKASIKAKRCVAKLGIYCTKSNSASTLVIKQITLGNIPNKGYLFEAPVDNSITYTYTYTTLSFTDDIDKFYKDAFPNNFEDFEKIEETSFTQVYYDYLQENLNGDEDEDIQIVDNEIADNKRYYIKLEYTLNGLDDEKIIYLSQMKRNLLSKIYIRINDATTINTCCQINSWTKHEMEVPAFE